MTDARQREHAASNDNGAGPRFSLLMPTKDRPDQLAVAIAAIRDQDYEDWELIIKDGGHSAAAVIPDDPRIVHLCEPDRNLAHALNTAMSHASGDIYYWSNDDDRLLPGALTCVAEEIGDAMWVRGLVELVVMPEGEVRVEGNDAWDAEALKRQNFVWTTGVFWRREAALAVGQMDEAVPLACDYDYWIRIGDRWEPKQVEHVLGRYVYHPESLSVRHLRRQYDDMDRIRARYGFGQLAAVAAELAACQQRNRDLTAEAAQLAEALDEIQASEFWRATRPLRWALDRSRGRR